MRTIITILCLIPLFAFSTTWERKVTNYDKTIYLVGQQNWMIDQGANGWLYIANTNGLLEYDGVYWNLYPANNRIVRSIKVTGDRIYTGGSSEFGYFTPQPDGILTYKSLSHHIPEWAGEAWNIEVKTGEPIL